MDLLDPRTPLLELQDVVARATLPESFGLPALPAFDKVRIFDLENLQVAFEELFMFGNRIALIAIDSMPHHSHISGRRMEVSRRLEVLILFSDRRYSDRVKALMGDETTPGALLLAKVLIDAISAELPCGAVVQPGDGRLLALEDQKRKDLTGRIVFSQPFTVLLDFDATALSSRARIGGAD